MTFFTSLKQRVLSKPAPSPAVRVGFGTHEGWGTVIRHHLAPRYAPCFVDLSNVRLDDFDVVIPLQTDHYATLIRAPRLRGRKFFHPSAEVVALCDDKLRLNAHLIASGFADLVPPLRDFGAPYPYVRKRRQGHWGLHCQIVRGPEDERDLDLTDPSWFAQAFVPGDTEYATHILRVDGRIRYASTFTYTMATGALVKGKHHSPVETGFALGGDHLDLFARILALLDYEGTACIDYRVVSCQPILFEINPRFGGSLCNQITGYVDAYMAALNTA